MSSSNKRTDGAHGAGNRSNQETPLVTPIYHATTYRMASIEFYQEQLKHNGHVYSRLGNPTCEAAEAAINELEGGFGSLLYASGMAAITSALFAFLKSGDHLVACNPIYSGTHSFVTKYLSHYNIEVDWVESGSPVTEYKKKTKPNTKVLLGETPCNPLISILDFEEFGNLGQSLDGVVTMVDSTYGSPYLQQPHKYNVDIVIHSGTKYIGGHSDVTAGVVSARTQELFTTLKSWRTILGSVLSPFDASLLHRGVRTMHVRMERHSDNAQKVAEFLCSHPKVANVHYPGLPTDPGHSIAKRQMKSFGGMLSFEVVGGLRPAKTLVENVRVIELAVSLGGTESLIELPALMTHGPSIMSDAERAEALISDGLIRLSVGLEDSDDLIKDLEGALAKVSVTTSQM